MRMGRTHGVVKARPCTTRNLRTGGRSIDLSGRRFFFAKRKSVFFSRMDADAAILIVLEPWITRFLLEQKTMEARAAANRSAPSYTLHVQAPRQLSAKLDSRGAWDRWIYPPGNLTRSPTIVTMRGLDGMARPMAGCFRTWSLCNLPWRTITPTAPRRGSAFTGSAPPSDNRTRLDRRANQVAASLRRKHVTIHQDQVLAVVHDKITPRWTIDYQPDHFEV